MMHLFRRNTESEDARECAVSAFRIAETPLDIDPEFERECTEALDQWQTPLDVLRVATDKICVILREKNSAHDTRIAELKTELAAEEADKASTLIEIAKVERALVQLGHAEPSPVNVVAITAKPGKRSKPAPIMQAAE